MEESCVHKSVKWLQGLAEGATGSAEFEVLTLAGLEIVEARESFIRCHFIVPLCLADKDGNWHAGAVATLIDIVGATAVYSAAGYAHVSVDFTISFYSTAKIHEEVEVVAKVVGYRGELPCVEVEIRRKGNGKLIALGRQWMYLRKNISQVQSKL